LKFQTNTPRLLRATLFTLLLTAFAGAGHEAFGQATTTTTNENIPFTSNMLNPCNGDSVTFSGTLHIVNTLTIDGSGGTHLKTHTNYQDVTGTGAPSGITYRVGTVSNEIINDSDGPQSNVTSISTVKLISPGPALNTFLRIVLHITINANGQTTSTVQEVSAECRGRI
jgi:hypothetical protein